MGAGKSHQNRGEPRPADGAQQPPGGQSGEESPRLVRVKEVVGQQPEERGSDHDDDADPEVEEEGHLRDASFDCQPERHEAHCKEDRGSDEQPIDRVSGDQPGKRRRRRTQDQGAEQVNIGQPLGAKVAQE